MSNTALQLVPPSATDKSAAPKTQLGAFATCSHLLTHDPAWLGVIAFDEFAQQIVFRRSPPFAANYPAAEYRSGHPLDDIDISRTMVWLDSMHGVRPSKEHTWDAVKLAAHSNKFHSVREYLDGLQWDGATRLERWLEDYCCVVPSSPEHENLVRAVAKRWMISCVARAMKPGCQVDTMLILEGAQGIGKSRGLEALAGKEFFCNTALDLGSKDAFQNIQGVWVYELAELDSLLRAESSQAKAFLSTSKDKFRPSYGRCPIECPRSVVFCGTVNHDSYLKDLSGSRRYWTICCDGNIDRDGLAAARDQLWAEAKALYENGEQWHLTPEEDALMQREHAEREPENLWETAMLKWLAEEPDGISYGDVPLERFARNDDVPFSLNDLWRGMQSHLTSGSTQKFNGQMLSALLQKNGYARVRKRVDGQRVRLFEKQSS